MTDHANPMAHVHRTEDGDEMRLGLHELLRRTGAIASRTYETSAATIALVELLISKGLIGFDEVEQRKRMVEPRMEAEFASARLNVELSPHGEDKYDMADHTVEIDCAARVHLCHAACCRLRFALSEQDVHEAVVRWDIERPYLNAQTAEGSCVHHRSSDGGCGVYEHRPAVCRGYDCRTDKRIWLDFDARVPNPDLLTATAPQAKAATG